MKPGWKTAIFKDVSTVVGGSTPKTDIPEYWGGDNYWLAPAELDGSKFISSTVKRITDLAVSKTNLSLLPRGTVLLSSRAPIGKVAITTVPMYCNQGFKNIVCGPELFNGYVYYFLKHNVDYLQSLGTGATFKEISKKVVENVSISYPSFEEQQRIVFELDLLTDIIDKKNAQLRDLDTLAQSIFYELFGDPITNEKGWPIKNVGEFADVTDYVANGSFATLRENVSYKSEPDYAILVRLADFSNAFDRRKFVYVDKHAYDFLAKSKLFGGEIIMSNVGSVGKSFICPDLGQPMSLAPNSIVIKTPNNIYSYACFQMPSFQLAIKGITSQTALPKFNKTEFKKIKVICPPAEMQTRYEVRWKAIQGQRERIKASLKDAQALLDSRMDYYFND